MKAKELGLGQGNSRGRGRGRGRGQGRFTGSRVFEEPVTAFQRECRYFALHFTALINYTMMYLAVFSMYKQIKEVNFLNLYRNNC